MRLCIVAGITIALTIALSACVTLDPAPPELSRGPPGPPGAASEEARPPDGPSGVPGAVTCDGPFGKDASHESIVKKFGASNVGYEEASLGFEDFMDKATILYPNDATRQLVIFWFDNAKRSGTAEIHITGKSQWTAGRLRLGMSLKQVEAVNKKPFTFHASGLVIVWRGGALELDRDSDGDRPNERRIHWCTLSITGNAVWV